MLRGRASRAMGLVLTRVAREHGLRTGSLASVAHPYDPRLCGVTRLIQGLPDARHKASGHLAQLLARGAVDQLDQP